jgi:hypothetical protein
MKRKIKNKTYARYEGRRQVGKGSAIVRLRTSVRRCWRGIVLSTQTVICRFRISQRIRVGSNDKSVRYIKFLPNTILHKVLLHGSGFDWDVFICKSSRPLLGFSRPPTQSAPGFCPGAKHSGRGISHLPPSSVERLTMGWTVRGLNLGGGEIFGTRPDRPWGPSSLLCYGYRVFLGGKAAGAWC